MLSNWSRGEVSSWEAGLYLPSDFLLRLAIIRKTKTPTIAMKSIPPTTGPTINAISPVRRADCIFNTSTFFTISSSLTFFNISDLFYLCIWSSRNWKSNEIFACQIVENWYHREIENENHSWYLPWWYNFALPIRRYNRIDKRELRHRKERRFPHFGKGLPSVKAKRRLISFFLKLGNQNAFELITKCHLEDLPIDKGPSFDSLFHNSHLHNHNYSFRLNCYIGHANMDQRSNIRRCLHDMYHQ